MATPQVNLESRVNQIMTHWANSVHTSLNPHGTLCDRIGTYFAKVSIHIQKDKVDSPVHFQSLSKV